MKCPPGPPPRNAGRYCGSVEVMAATPTSLGGRGTPSRTGEGTVRFRVRIPRGTSFTTDPRCTGSWQAHPKRHVSMYRSHTTPDSANRTAAGWIAVSGPMD